MNAVQQTIENPVTLSGVGLHTGVETSVTFHPAPENSGIQFARSDLPGRPKIRADVDNVEKVSRRTVLSSNGIRLHTVEHVLAAVAGLQIDNILVELTEREPPALDGSAEGFVEALIKGGIAGQKTPRRILELDQPVSFVDEASGISIRAVPSDDFSVTCTLEYDQPVPGYQTVTMNSLGDFALEIAPARTYCFLSELDELRRRGLAKGGSLQNALVIVDRDLDDEQVGRLRKEFHIDGEVVLGTNGILQDVALKFDNEPVRHKVLDLLGDLALLGMPLRGHVIAVRSGHASHVELVRRIRKASLYHA